jgi:O-antigen ligase
MVLAVVAVSIAAPRVVPENRFRLLIGLVAAIAAVWLFLRWPALGLLALIVMALFAPSLSLPGGLNLAVLFLILLIGLWVLDMIVIKRLRLLSSRPIRPLLALILVACISFGIGQFGWFTFAQTAPMDAQIAGVLIFVLSIGAFLVTAHQVTSLRWLQLLTFLFIGLGALFMLGWIVSPVGNITGQFFRHGAIANGMFWTWLVVLAFSQAMFNRKLHIGWRIVLALIVGMTLFVAYFKNDGWKSGYLPAFVAIAAMIGARSWRTGVVIVLLSIVPAIYLSSQAIATDEYSYSTRLDAWLIMLEIIKVNPILGLGPANYYWYTPFFPIRGYAVQFNSHNQYIDIVAQTGLFGLACFLWFGAEMAWLGINLRKRAPEGFAQAYVYGAIGGLAGTFAAAMLVDWVFPFVYNIGLNGMRGSMLAWIFLGGLISIEQIVRRQEVADAPVLEVELVGGTI